METITIKIMGGNTFNVDVSIASMRVVDLKQVISIIHPNQHIKACRDCIKLVHLGKVLADNEASLQSLQMQSGETLYAVVSKKFHCKQDSCSCHAKLETLGIPRPILSSTTSPTSPTTPTTTTTPTPTPDPFATMFQSIGLHPQQQASTTTTPTTPAPNPFAAMMNGMGGMGNMGNMGSTMGGMPNMQQMQQQMRQNPEMMRDMMRNPMVQQMMEQMANNPNSMMQMMQNNPEMQALLEQHPEMRQAMEDPENMRRSMRAAMDPDYMRAMMQQQDRALSNISRHPEGFNALQRMHSEISEPMHAAMNGAMAANNTASPEARRAQQEANASMANTTNNNGPTNSALPNPWGAPSPSTAATAATAATSATTPSTTTMVVIPSQL